MPHGLAGWVLVAALVCFAAAALLADRPSRLGWLGLAFLTAAQFLYGK